MKNKKEIKYQKAQPYPIPSPTKVIPNIFEVGPNKMFENAKFPNCSGEKRTPNNYIIVSRKMTKKVGA
jgi:hypothetical protein